MSKEIKWNVVSEVGYPKEEGYYYITYKDFENEKETRIALTRIDLVPENDGLPIDVDSYRIYEGDIIAWSKADIDMPNLYIPKEEKKDEKVQTIGDFIRSASDEDISVLVGCFLAEYTMMKMKAEGKSGTDLLLDALGEAGALAIFGTHIKETLKKTYKGSVYERSKRV